MIRRWIVIYYNGDETKAAMIDDDSSDGSVKMPFGVEPHQVADDCVDITAIIEVNDNTDVPMVVIDDEEFSLDPADPDVDEEDVPA
jgi:hypothetical protein